jgi:hypothetical protein
LRCEEAGLLVHIAVTVGRRRGCWRCDNGGSSGLVLLALRLPGVLPRLLPRLGPQLPRRAHRLPRFRRWASPGPYHTWHPRDRFGHRSGWTVRRAH